MKAGFTNLLGGISKALTIPPDDDDHADVLRVTPSGNFEVFDKAKVSNNIWLAYVCFESIK